MKIRMMLPWLALVLVVGGRAAELATTSFAHTPEPGALEMMAPRALVADSAANRCLVLDSGLNRVLALGPDGQSAASWPLAARNIDISAALPPDPLLPAPALAVAGDAVYLLSPDRAQNQLAIAVISGKGAARTVTLPEHASNGAFVLDAAGRTLAAYLQVNAGKLELVLARENADGTMSTLGTLVDPCEGLLKNLDLTGFAITPEGQLAIGIAQSGDAAYSFIRSWLVQGTVIEDTLTEKLHLTHRVALVDQRGKIVDRYRMSAQLAGHDGYPAKPCVHLFTSLALSADGLLISGGHTYDPFLRIYDKDGRLLRTLPWLATGGQHVAVLEGKERARIFTLSSESGRVEEIAVDGRVLSGIGHALPYDLSHIFSLAADKKNVYAAARWSSRWHLVHFTADGRFLWALDLQPPRGMEKAQPFLATPTTDRVLIGWRQPHTAGIGWVDSVLDDGSPGAPLWSPPYLTLGTATAVCSSPLIIGDNSRIYVLREMADGTRLQALSSSGAFLQAFPATIQGISFVDANQNLAWAHLEGDGMTIGRNSSEGADRGWKRVPRPVGDGAALLPVSANGFWGWFTSTHSLLHLDETMTVTDEATLTTPDAHTIEGLSAITGDRGGHIYLAVPEQILVVTP